MSEPGGDDAGWRPPSDEAGEQASVFEARIVPAATQQEASAALLAAISRHIAVQSKLPPPHGPDGYIWHRDAPRLYAAQDPAYPCGTGILNARVQDCVDDEWYLTWLLLEITRRHPGTCISVRDEDGEFLLVEGADALPSWVNPENAENRVWLYEGHLHLVPLEYRTQAADAGRSAPFLSVKDAVDLVRNPQVATNAPPELEEAALTRLSGYPLAAIEHHHYCLAYLPNTAAQVLLRHPQLVADAVHALSTRDVVSSRAAQRLDKFRIAASAELTHGLPAENAVLVRVKLTRHLYAQLLHDRYFPPKAFGKAWQHATEQYRLHVARDSGAQSSVSEDAATRGRWCDIGAKLTAGLEMFLDAQSSRATGGSERLSQDLGHTAHERFLASLTKLGYFGNEVRGSAQWNELERQAVEARRQMASEEPTSSDTRQLLRNIRASIDGPLEAGQSLDASADTHRLRTQEDSEDWLALAPDDLETMLTRTGMNEDRQSAAEEQAVGKLGQFMDKMRAFVEGQGDVEGAMFQDDEFDDGDEADADVAESDSEEGIRTGLSQAEKEKRMAELVPGLDASEWGANSQPQPPPAAPKQPSGSEVLAPAQSPKKQRLHGFSNSERYEGASDSDNESLEGDENDPLEERVDRAKWLDEQVSQDAGAPDVALDDEDEQMERVMKDDMHNFLDFTRRTLGLSEEQYGDILRQRKQRGGTSCRGLARTNAAAYVPDADVPAPALGAQAPGTKGKQPAYIPPPTENGPRPNPQLNSFDTVLAAMEKELTAERAKRSGTDTPAAAAMDVDEELSPEDQELLQQLLASGAPLPESLRRFAEDNDVEDADVEMLGNFLESFKAQGAGAGPVSNLSGRFGTGNLPRDAGP